MTNEQPFNFELDGERLVDKSNLIAIGAFGGPEYSIDIRIMSMTCPEGPADLILTMYVELTSMDRALKLDVIDSLFGLGATEDHRNRMEDLLEAAFPRLLDLPFWTWAHRADVITLNVPKDWRYSLLNPPTWRQRLWRSLFAKPKRVAMEEVARRPVEPITALP